jgi:hypothetical protein
MTTPARQEEADRVELVYQYALTQLGVDTVEEAIELWQEVPPTEAAATSARWLSRAIQLIMTRRARSRDLGLAYYRLVRALRTGRTIADPRKPEPEYVSLEMLRREFELMVDEVAPESPQEAPQPAQDGPAEDESTDAPPADPQPSEPPELTSESLDDDDEILLEEIAELEAEADRLEQEAEQEAAVLMDELGTENLIKKLQVIDTSAPADEVDVKRDEAHRKAGSRQAAVAERITKNAARGLVYSLGEYDGAVIGWARFSTTGTPCGWCAMLLSRGAVYKSARNAQHQGKNQDEDKYHDNCNCIAVPLFFEGQYDGSDIFGLNKEYDRLWQNGDRANGLPKNPSLEVWRSYFRRMAKVQEAAPSQS